MLHDLLVHTLILTTGIMLGVVGTLLVVRNNRLKAERMLDKIKKS